MGLREKKKDQTRSQLIDAAFALIEKQGYQQTTINEIAAEVNVSPRTFLRYFPTKDDVVVGWIENTMEVLSTSLVEVAGNQPPDEALVYASRAMLTHYQSRGQFHHKLEEIIATSSTLQARKQQRIEALSTEVSEVLQRLYGREHSILILDVYAGIAVSLCRASIREWLTNKNGEDILSIFERARTISAKHLPSL